LNTTALQIYSIDEVRTRVFIVGNGLRSVYQ